MVLSHFLSHPLRLTLSTLKLVCAVHLLQTHLLQISPTAGPSMLPTFSVDGDWIIADMRHARNRLALSSTSSRESSSNGKLEGGFNSNDDKEEKGLKIGDLILYKIPISQTNSGIKRLVGLPGDYVSIGTPGDIGEERMIQVFHLPSPLSHLTSTFPIYFSPLFPSTFLFLPFPISF